MFNLITLFFENWYELKKFQDLMKVAELSFHSSNQEDYAATITLDVFSEMLHCCYTKFLSLEQMHFICLECFDSNNFQNYSKEIIIGYIVMRWLNKFIHKW